MPLDEFQKRVIAVVSRNRDSKSPFADDACATAADTDWRQFNSRGRKGGGRMRVQLRFLMGRRGASRAQFQRFCRS